MLSMAVTPDAGGVTLFEDGFENGMSSWTTVRGVAAQSVDVATGAGAAEATSTGEPAYARKKLGVSSTDMSYALQFKVVSQGATNVTLAAVRPATGGPVAGLFVNSRGKLALKTSTTVTVSPESVSGNVWHSLRLQVHVAGAASQTEVWLDGASIPALDTTASLGTAAVTKVDIGDPTTKRSFTLRFDDVSVTEVVVDASPPTAPSYLTAAASSAHRVDLSWVAAIDDVGVTGYDVFRDGTQVASLGVVTSYSDATVQPDSPYSYEVRARDLADNIGQPSAAAAATTPPAAAEPDPVIAAAGDIACAPAGAVTASTCRQMATSDLLFGRQLAQVLTVGDNQYEKGLLDDFRNAYGLSWGRVKDITSPTAGNHEYLTEGAAGYFDYFGAAAGDRTKGYYSFDVGTWHLIALNSNCAALAPADGCAEGTPQNNWLEADLAAHSNACTLAYWHHPRFSTGEHGDSLAVAPFWDDLYAAGADVVLGGHSHNYERYTPVDPSGVEDPAAGIGEFVVGTGGKNHVVRSTTPPPTSMVRNFTTFGVLELTLRPDTYDWDFVPEAGATFTDSGSGACH